MAVSVTLTDVTSGYNLSVINANFDAIETALADCVSRSGDTPNTLSADLDANSNTVTNLATPSSNTDAATKKYVDDEVGDATVQAAAAAASAAAALVSETNAAASESAAASSESAASSAQTNAETAETNAETAETGALAAQTAAELARDASIAASETLAWGYSFDNGTADADPGSTKLRFNNATISSATFMYINETADEGSIANAMDEWDQSTSTIKGVLKIRNPLAPTNWVEFYISGSITDAGTYRKVPISFIASNGSLSNGDELLLLPLRNGDAGTGAVDSWNTRTGAVTPAASDYDASMIDNDSGVTGAFVDDALNTLNTDKVDTSGTPVVNDFAKFTDSNTVEGRSYSETLSDLSLDTAAKLDSENQALTGGFAVTIKDLGTKSSGTHTMDVADRPTQKLVNGGAFTLAPGTIEGSCLLLVTNNASAGAITTSGFTFVDGDAFTTTNAHKFLCQVTVVDSSSILTVKALQ